MMTMTTKMMMLVVVVLVTTVTMMMMMMMMIYDDCDDDDDDRGTGAADSAWMLLQTYLRRHGDNSSRYYRSTATKLLQHGFSLPTWLTADYKVRALHMIHVFLSFFSFFLIMG